MTVYEIPIVSASLHQEEMIGQICDCLQHLDAVSKDIFSKVSAKINHSRSRIENIKDRVIVAQKKIESIKGSKKATKIFSSSRFPSSFQSDNDCLFGLSNVFLNRTTLEIQNMEVSSNINDLIFYPPHNANHIAHHCSLNNPQSVSELLIFNSEDLAFQGQSLSDKSIKSTLRRKHDSDISVDTSIGDAPWSISQRDQLERSNPLNFSYMPGLGDVPELDLPLALPDLPGICDDLAYSEEIGPGIAPSLIAALPDLSQLTEVVKPITRTFHEQSSLSDTTTPLYFVAETLPLPPPPIVSVPPPPPPPPPPPQLLANTSKAQLVGTEIEKLVSKPAPLIPQPTDDLRSSLMAAIREAGGTGKLKSARVKHTQAVKEQQSASKPSSSQSTHAPAVGGGDLMADLFNKLSMRRKGISGQNADAASSSMERISALIPPPPSANANQSTISDDVEEWK